MTHQITRADEDYDALAAASAQRGASVERLIYDAALRLYAKQQRVYSNPTGSEIDPPLRAESTDQ